MLKEFVLIFFYEVRFTQTFKYIGVSTRHLGTRAGEYLNLDDSHKSAIKDHLRFCRQCCNGVCNITCFKMLRKCNTDYDTKIHEALLIKKLRPQLNKQLNGKGASFLLNLF